MKKILVSFLLVNCFAVFAEKEKENFGLFEKYHKTQPLLSRLTGSDRGARYIGSLSDQENPSLSLKGYRNYIIMKCGCKLGYSVNFLDKNENKHTAYICSPDESIVKEAINDLKNGFLKDFKNMGEKLKQRGMVCNGLVDNERVQLGEHTLVQSDDNDDEDDGKEFAFASFYRLADVDIDSTKLGYVVSQMIEKSQYGLHIIDGNLIKITVVPNHGMIKISELVPTKEEIEKAKATISQ